MKRVTVGPWELRKNHTFGGAPSQNHRKNHSFSRAAWQNDGKTYVSHIYVQIDVFWTRLWLGKGPRRLLEALEGPRRLRKALEGLGRPSQAPVGLGRPWQALSELAPACAGLPQP